jgi:hypothetical protein
VGDDDLPHTLSRDPELLGDGFQGETLAAKLDDLLVSCPWLLHIHFLALSQWHCQQKELTGMHDVATQHPRGEFLSW